MPRNQWSQGKYRPHFPQKYIGVKAPVYRSSWEQRLFTYCDMNKNVLKWGAELIEIPYFFHIDQKKHRYVTDVYMEVKQSSGKVIKYVVEVKPNQQNPLHEKFKQPKPPKRKTAKSWGNYQERLIDNERNLAKWRAASAFCKKRGYVFKIVGEDDLL